VYTLRSCIQRDSKSTPNSCPSATAVMHLIFVRLRRTIQDKLSRSSAILIDGSTHFIPHCRHIQPFINNMRSISQQRYLRIRFTAILTPWFPILVMLSPYASEVQVFPHHIVPADCSKIEEYRKAKQRIIFQQNRVPHVIFRMHRDRWPFSFAPGVAAGLSCGLWRQTSVAWGQR